MSVPQTTILPACEPFEAALSVLDILGNLLSQRSFAEGLKPCAQLVQVGILVHILRAKKGNFPEDLAVEDRAY